MNEQKYKTMIHVFLVSCFLLKHVYLKLNDQTNNTILTIAVLWLVVIFSKVQRTYHSRFVGCPQFAFLSWFLSLYSNDPLLRQRTQGWKFEAILFHAAWHSTLRHAEANKLVIFVIDSSMALL